MCTKRVNGFTLVELLVVIAIISVLAALLLPALAESLLRARIISCSNHQKQIALSMTLYLEDGDDMVPPSYFIQSGGTVVTHRSSPSTRWYKTSGPKLPMRIGYLYPNYLEDGHVFHCPDIEYLGNAPAYANMALSYDGKYTTDYGWKPAEPNTPTAQWYANSNYNALAIVDAVTEQLTDADFNLFPTYHTRFKTRSLLPRADKNLHRPLVWDVGRGTCGDPRAWLACLQRCILGCLGGHTSGRL